MKLSSLSAGLAAIVLYSSSVSAQAAEKLEPLLAVPDQIVLEQDFSQPAELDKQQWAARQGTRWSIEEGVLRGLPSTPEYQAAHKDHKGLEARISAPITPHQFVARFAIRFVGGEATNIVPFVEFGHHVARVKFAADGLTLLVEGETLKVAEAKDFHFEPGKWYHLLAEMKGDELVVQIADGPTLYARHAGFGKPAATGGAGLGVAGTVGGTVELDDVTLWSIKPAAQPNWSSTRETYPKFTPVELPKARGPAKKKTS